MSTVNQIQVTKPVSSMKMLQAMVGIGVMCALFIVLTYEGTLPRIEKLRAAALEKAIFKVLPGTTKTATYQLEETNSFLPLDKSNPGENLVYAGFNDNDELVGIAIEGAGQGYADIIRILYGYSPSKQQVVGFYVLESKETPGLGDKIEKDDNFLDNFKALDVSLNNDKSGLKNTVSYVKSGTKQNPWEVDGITGATISSKAIGEIFQKNTAQIVPLLYNSQEAFIVQETIEDNLNE